MGEQTVSDALAVRTVQADLATPLGQASIVQDRFARPYDQSGRTDYHHLQLSLLHYRENGRGCFPEVWGRGRFEPIGPLFLLPAKHVVHVRSDCPEQRSIVFSFGDHALERWFERGVEWSSSQLERSLVIADPEIRRLMMGIGRELRSPGFASEAMVELMGGQIIIALARQLRMVDSAAAKGGLTPWRLRLIDDYLAEHPAQSSLTALAEACGLSVRQMSRAFRISRGCSIGAHIAQRKMAFAQSRLAMGVPAKTVARETGFSSASNFAAAFRRATGETPRGGYRKAANAQASPAT